MIGSLHHSSKGKGWEAALRTLQPPISRTMTEYHSISAEEFRTETENPDRLRTLAELHPQEISFFKKRFVWSSNTSGCYVRHRYEKLVIPLVMTVPKWCPVKTRGEWQHLYPALVDSLVEKHLDFERFFKTSRLGPSLDRLEPNADETAFWLGTMAGDQTHNDCIDLDSHDQIGWNPVPTMWHSSRTGCVDGPYSWRHVPVMRPSMRFFQIAKVIYDHFPNRIWAFSSANFGLAVWKVYDQPELTHVVYRKVGASLQAAGLTVEHYPMPAKTGLGKCHRRPCGMDSAIITDNGLITDSIQQIRAYMSPPKTPSFQTILEACCDGLRRSYDVFFKDGESMAHQRMSGDEKKFVVKSCLAILEDIKSWARAGCPIDHKLILEVQEVAEEHDDVGDGDQNIGSCDSDFETDSANVSDEFPDFFWQASLKAVNKSAQWVQFVEFLVNTGVPAEDKFNQVILTLARWFCFVELFGEDPDRIKAVLRRFALTRHNNKVTRLLAGQEEDVLSHADRIVDHALAHEDSDGKELFARIRQKRATGQYKKNHFFESQILRDERNCLSSPSQPISLFYLSCGGLISDSAPEEDTSEWSYQPDDTPLPDEVMNRIRLAFKTSKKQIRRNKTTGRFPVLDSITRFFNYLVSGRKSGTRRAGQDLLIQMGFPEKNSERDRIIAVLLGDGLLHKGGYLATQKSRQWFLDSSVIMAMHEARQQQRNVI